MDVRANNLNGSRATQGAAAQPSLVVRRPCVCRLADCLHDAHAVEHAHVGQGIHVGLEDVLGELVAHGGAQLLRVPRLADVIVQARLVDGADASRFLMDVKKRLEEGTFEADLGL